MRGARAAALLLIVALLGGVTFPAYAADQVIATELLVPGTPEADGEPVDLDATILTTAPATPRPAIVLAHGFGGTKIDSEPKARTHALAA
jgi:ABC-2 type transport system ATP-binding protein